MSGKLHRVMELIAPASGGIGTDLSPNIPTLTYAKYILRKSMLHWNGSFVWRMADVGPERWRRKQDQRLLKEFGL
ncbi:hypothetical protein [Kumtagia ephedrae]|uniref:hypothetical protein n=1 Tax=Kumtagia ephedrae TaxID=2116701 RepID=UPI00105710F2|nr:hypothetical protein [Mesorhizobium ephedrae]